MENITKQIEQLCIAESAKYEDKIYDHVMERGEVFTPTSVVLEILQNMPEGTWTEGFTFLDPECGIGQMIIPAAIIKQTLGHSNILSVIYGVELIQDNVDLCRTRLLDIFGHTEANIKQVEQNIVCANSLTYDFKFNSN
jgi:type I restriction-modification system DNA methylase subunit